MYESISETLSYLKISKRYFWAYEKSSDKNPFLNLNIAIVLYGGCFVGEHLINELTDFMKEH